MIDIDAMPPEIERLAEDEYEIISGRISCKLASVPILQLVLAVEGEMPAEPLKSLDTTKPPITDE